MKTLRVVINFCSLVCLAGMAAARLAAADGQVVQVNPSGDEYRVFCAACHGAEGRGDGPVAKSLRRRPADLTQLARRNNGTFPSDMVFQIIEGKRPISGHGGPEMPAWGAVFSQSRESQDPEGVKARIESLVKYLQKIQDVR